MYHIYTEYNNLDRNITYHTKCQNGKIKNKY